MWNLLLESKRYKQYTENFFLFVFALELLYLFQGVTMMKLALPGITSLALGFLICIATAFRIPYILSNRKYFPMYGLMGIIYLLTFRSVGYKFLILYFVITVGCTGIEYKKMIRTYVFVIGPALLMTWILANAGVIPNLVYSLKDGIPRSSWGITYPTDMAAFCVFLLIYLSILYQGVSELVFLVIGILTCVFIHFVTKSDTSTICSMLFCLTCIYRWILTKLSRYRLTGWIGKAVDTASVMSFPVLLGIMVFLVKGYRNGEGYAIAANRVLSLRVGLAAEAWNKYGIKAFGTPFEMTGYGGTTFDVLQYEFIDSGYMMILIRYGWVILSMLGIMWMCMTWRACKAGDRRLSLGMVLIAVSAVMEPNFFELRYNALCCMPFAMYSVYAQKKAEEQKASDKSWKWNKINSFQLSAIFAVLMVCALLPKLCSRFRTVITLCELNQGGFQIIAAVFCVALFLVCVVMLTAVGAVILDHILRKESWKCVENRTKIVLSGGILSGAILLCSYVWTEQVIKNHLNNEYAAQIVQEDALIEQICDLASGIITADRIPTLYKKAYPKLSETLLSGEDLARYSCVSIIMDHDYEAGILFAKGFLFLELSPYHVLYTNDKELIKGMERIGYHLAGYYAAERMVHVTEILNEQEWEALMSENEPAYENKSEDASEESGIDLCGGDYTIVSDMILTDSKRELHEKAGTLLVKAYGDKIKIGECEVYHDQFGEDGHLRLEYPFRSGKYPQLSLYWKSEPGVHLTVEDSVIQKTPDNDNRYEYDRKGRVIKVEYFDRSGKRMKDFNGASACEYTYDNIGNVTSISYFDETGLPLMLEGGYASIKQVYDALGNCTQTSYYDANQNLTLTHMGYAMSERRFNSKNRLIAESYYGCEKEPVLGENGFASIEYEYIEDIYTDKITKKDERGSVISVEERQDYRMLEDLENLMGNPDAIIALSVLDEGSAAQSESVRDYMRDLGFTVLSELSMRDSYIGIYTGGEVLYEQKDHGNKPITYENVDEELKVVSAGWDAGCISSISWRGDEYSLMGRGINVAAFDSKKGTVLAQKSYDTYQYLVRLPANK